MQKKNPSTFGPIPPSSLSGKQTIIVPTNLILSLILDVKIFVQCIFFGKYIGKIGPKTSEFKNI